jgi:DEAD/DEAH box helicase domain-containing protein
VTLPTLVLDVETQRLAHEVGGWEHVDRLGLAAAVVLDIGTGQFHRYTERDAERLVAQLHGAGHIVGYNVLRFDYTVLRPYGFEPGRLEPAQTTDMLEHLMRRLGFRVSLDNVAAATLGTQKSADGLAAVAWYRQGEIAKVLDYCEEDVRITARLWEHGRAKHQIAYRDREYRLRTVPVAW